MNTPEQEAEQLIQQFRIFVGISDDGEGGTVNNYLSSKKVAKLSALISVDKIITAEMEGDIIPYGLEKIKYWETVKKIIQSK